MLPKSLRCSVLAAIVTALPAVASAQQPAGAAPPAPAAPAAAAPAATPAAPAPAEAPAAPAPAPATEAGPAPEPPPPGPAATAATPETDAPAAPKKLAVGSEGFFQPSADLQGWFYLLNTKTTGAPDTSFTFRLRRAELKVKGEIIPKLFGYGVMVDPAKTLKFGTQTAIVENQDPPPTDPAAPEQVTVLAPPADTSILQDFYIKFMSDYADVSLGQFKIPVSYEGSNSSSKLLLPERALVSRTFGDKRDVGVKVEKKFQYVGYVLGLYNGEGPNRLDSNNQKDLALRLEGYPVKGILIGAVGYVALGQRSQATTKDRVEGDVRVDVEHALLQAEYIHGWDGPKGARTEAHGAYGTLGYTFAEKYQPVVRVGFFDPNVNADNTTLTEYALGFNYYVLKNELKFQAAYGLTESAAVGASRRHEVTLAAQLSF